MGRAERPGLSRRGEHGEKNFPLAASAAAPLSNTSATVSRAIWLLSNKILRRFVGISRVARADLMAQANAVFPVQQLAQPRLTQIVAAWLVISPPRLLRRTSNITRLGEVVGAEATLHRLHASHLA